MAEERALKATMTPELWQRLKPLYDAALEMPEAERAKVVAQACRNDSELGKELAALLKASTEPTGTGDVPIVNFRNLFPPCSKPFSIGELVLGRFEVVRHLGTGGMGEVYEAIDRELGRIALKTIRPEVAGNPDTLARFKKEVQVARKISGPHVCRIHELFVIAASVKEPQKVFLTMELLDGMTLADKISDNGPFSWQEARLIALQICDGLHTIHEAGIIHRDLKSRNIMLASRNGSICAVLMDFGLAREISTPATGTLTGSVASGVIAGTPDYMAPEQFAGKELTPATDVYALGIVLYELVTSKHPFVATSLIEAAVQRGESPCLASSIQPGLPRQCDEIICKCLEYDPKRRYQSAKKVVEALQNRAYLLGVKQKWFRLVAGIIGVAVLLSSLLLIPAVGERVRGMLFSSPEKHIAVLPLDFVGSNPETEALGDGLMDSLAGKLSNLGVANQSLWVIPASEVRSRRVNDPSSALREFGATTVVKGSFEHHNQATQLKLTLIDTKKMREIGFVEVENQAGDLAALQDEAVTRLGRLMNISVKENLLRGDADRVTRAAYEDYLSALGYIQRFDKAGNLDLAITALQRAVSTDPRFALGFARLGEAYRLKYELDRNPQWLDKAKEYCRRAAEMDSRVQATYVTLARIHELSGNHDLAVQEFRQALDIDSRDGEALGGLAHSYQKMGRISEAEATYIKAAAVRPDDWSGYNSLGNFYDDIGRHQEAIKQYQRALRLTPDNSVLCANLGAAYLNSGDPRTLHYAESALKRSIEINPNYAAYANLGNLYGIQSRFAESAAATEKALQIDDLDYDVWNNLADAYEWLGANDKARSARSRAIQGAEQVVKLNPQDAEAHATLAALLARNEARQEAMANIQISLALSPNSQYVLSEVADAYASLGDRQSSIRYIERAVKNGFPVAQLKGDPYLRDVIRDIHLQVPAK